jgi:hypothetical protein
MRSGDLLVTVGFVAILFSVPLSQIVLELRRGQDVQFTDVFRCVPTPANLRRYENALENQSWLRQAVRPAIQWALFAVFKDAGPECLLSADGWLFYRPGVRYLVEGERSEVPEPCSTAINVSDLVKTVLSADWARFVERLLPEEIRFAVVKPRGHTAGRRQAVRDAILEYRRQLKERGIELLVMPVPEKSAVYPGRLTSCAGIESFRSPSEALLDDLRREGVEVIDLFELFRKFRREAAQEGMGDSLYLASDTHWTPEGARLAAETVARRIRERGWLPESSRKYTTTIVQVQRRGDLVGMMQAPGLHRYFPPEMVTCRQVTDKIVGLLAQRVGGEGTFANTHLKDTPMEPSVLLLGDSFSRIYQIAEPKSLSVTDGQAGPGVSGQAFQSKSSSRLLPGSAGFPSLLVEILQSPVDYIVSDGGAATEVRQRLSINSEILENKKVVVWEFTERDVGLGRRGWRQVPLPPKL